VAIDLNRIAAAAAESYLKVSEGSPNGQSAPQKEEKRRRFGAAGAIALGAGLAVAARAVYDRARRFDLEQAAGRVEDKLSD
jgi:hypothetical protein